MRSSIIWSRISVPVVDNEGTVAWRKISDLGVVNAVSMEREKKTDAFQLICSDGKKLQTPESLIRWFEEEAKSTAHADVSELVAAMSTVVPIGDSTGLDLRPPIENLPPEANLLGGVYCLHYSLELATLFSVEMVAPLRTVNRYHPLVREAMTSKYVEQKSELQEFAETAIQSFTAPATIALLKGATSKIERQQRLAGYGFEAVDWASVAEDLRPPYTIRGSAGEILEITEEDFKRWAAAPIENH
jgi:hypothetical protein